MDIDSTLQLFKETITFLVEQEKIRAKEIEALNAKIDSLNDIITKQIMEPVNEYIDDKAYDEFKAKYGERLGAFDNTMSATERVDGYDTTRQTFDSIKQLEDYPNVDMDSIVDGVESDLKQYVEGIKAQFGISPDTPVEITETPGGEVEVKADTDKDGEAETVVASETVEETPVEETATEEINVGNPDEEKVADSLKKIGLVNSKRY